MYAILFELFLNINTAYTAYCCYFVIHKHVCSGGSRILVLGALERGVIYASSNWYYSRIYLFVKRTTVKGNGFRVFLVREGT